MEDNGKLSVIGMGLPRFSDSSPAFRDLSEADRQSYFYEDIWHVEGEDEYHCAVHCPEAIALSNQSPNSMMDGTGGLPCCPTCVDCLE